MELLYNGPWCPYRLKNSQSQECILFGIVRPINSTGYCWCYLVTLQNFMVRPCCWRHHIPTWVAEHGKIKLVLAWKVLFMLLKEKNNHQSYTDVSPVSHNNSWQVIPTHWQKWREHHVTTFWLNLSPALQDDTHTQRHYWAKSLCLGRP